MRRLGILCLLASACGSSAQNPDMKAHDMSVVDPALPEGTMLAPAQTLTTCLATDGARVYWADQAGVLAVPVTGGAVATLVPGKRNRGCVAVDGDYAFYVDEDADAGGAHAIWRVPTQGGTPSLVVTGQHVAGNLVAQGGHVYFLTDLFGPADMGSTGKSAIVRVPATGGSVEVVYAEVTPPAGELAVDAQNLYFSDGAGVFARPRAGGALVSFGVSNLHRNAFVVGQAHLAMAEVASLGVGDVAVMKLDGTGRVVVHAALATPLAVDEKGVYTSLENRLVRLPLDASAAPVPPVALASRAARAVALDGGAIYFTDGAAILKLPR